MRRIVITLIVMVLTSVAAVHGLRATMVRADTPADVGDVAPRGVLSSSIDHPRPLRLAALGTSLTHDYSWPEGVARLLGTSLGREVQLVRAARPGATSEWGRSAVRQFDLSDADVVLIEFLANDADLLETMTIATSRRNHLEMIEYLRAHAVATGKAAPVVVLMTMSPTHGIRGLMRLRMPGFAAMYSDLARTTGAGLIDLTSRWGPSERFPDGLHPTDDQANSVVPEVVADYLRSAIG